MFAANSISEDLKPFQAELGDAVTQTVFDDNIPIVRQPLKEARTYASFSYDVIWPERMRVIFLSDQSKPSNLEFFHFSHEAKHYQQNTTMPNFHLLSRIAPDEAFFSKRVCELDAYLYEGEKASLHYIKTKNADELEENFNAHGIGVQLYAASIGMASFGTFGDCSFDTTKKNLDRIPQSLLPEKYMQATRAYFCYYFAAEKDLFGLWDGMVAQSLTGLFNTIYEAPIESFLSVKDDLFAHSASKPQAEKLLYQNNPNQAFLKYLSRPALEEFWKNMQEIPSEFEKELPVYHEASDTIKENLKKTFG